MDPGLSLFLLGVALATSVGGAVVLLHLLPRWRREARDEVREQLRREADVSAREQLLRERDVLERGAAERAAKLGELEDRVRAREEALDRRYEALEDRERDLQRREATFKGAHAELEAREAEVARTAERQLRELERISELRREEAERLLLERIERRCDAEVQEAVARHEEHLGEELARRSRDALLTALQRTALDHAHEALVSVVALPSEELKGLLIGRDGRNIRSFESQTGCDLIVDDTPGAVVVSGFDPVRREVARRALVRLLDEGRIHPPRIEVVVAEARQELEEAVQELGRAAAAEVGLDLPPRLITLLGRLAFCTSEGHNVLRHSVETAHLAGTLAGELGLDPGLARRCGLLHDIGKAVDHETDGGHAAVGAAAAQECEEAAVVVNAIAAHHGDAAATSPYAVIAEIANRISADRPGARNGQIEAALRRCEQVEALASRYAGVERAYAVQAGRELRLVVDPGRVNDRAAQRLARDVAREVGQADLAPGRVKVTVIRPVRAEAESA